MATHGIIGTLSISITEGEDTYVIASLRSARLSVQTQMLPALHPSVYDWKHFIPGIQNWRADADALQMIDSATSLRLTYLYKLEQLCLSQTPVSILFTSDAGNELQGEAYIDNFQIGGNYEDGFSGQFGLAGVGALLLSDDVTPNADQGTLFVGTYDSNNTLMDEFSVMRVNPDGSTVALKSFNALLTPEITLTIDESDRWLFAVNGLEIWRMRFDGSNQSLIYTLAGYDRIGDIVYMSGGTYDGYLFFTAVNTGAGTDDDVYRVFKDGTNSAKVSSNQYAGLPMGIAIRNTSQIIVNAGFSNGGILSFGAAGTVYNVENSTQLFNSSMGITYDPGTDQAYTERGIATSALARTPAGLAGSYTDFTGFGTLGRLTPLWFDRAAQVIYYGGTGIKYRAIGALSTAVQVSPTTGGSGPTGNYGTTKIVAVQ